MVLASCDSGTLSESVGVDPEAKSLNDKAMEQYSQLVFKSLYESKTELEDVLDMLNQAIAIDDDYALAYSNKASVLVKMQRYEEAIETLDQASKLKSDFAEVICLQGFYYEKIGDFSSAKEKYKSAAQAYDNRIAVSNQLQDKVSRAFLFLFIKGKSAALNEIDSLQMKHPENQLIIGMRNTIIQFDRDTYIDNL